MDLSGSNNIPKKQLAVISDVERAFNFFKEGKTTAFRKLFLKCLKKSKKFEFQSVNNHLKIKGFIEKLENNKAEDWTGSFGQKAYTILKIYSVIKNYFAGYDCLIDFSWEEKVLEFAPQILASKDKAEFLELLAKLVSSLEENHTFISYSKEFEKEQNLGYFPLDVKIIAGRFVVTKVLSESLQEKLYPGLEIVKIGKRKPLDIYDEFKDKSFLSKAEKRGKYKAYLALKGDLDEEVEIFFYDKLKDLELTYTLRREIRTNNSKDLYEYRSLEDNILYFNFKSFGNIDYEKITTPFEEELAKHNLNDIKGMIIDLRENQGGTSMTGDKIISHLTENPARHWHQSDAKKLKKLGIPSFLYFIFSIVCFFKKKINISYSISPAEKNIFTKKVMVLISGKTGSGAEEFAVTIKENKIGSLIGEFTSGGTGGPAFYMLPDYSSLRVCLNLGVYQDGSLWHDRGVEPDIEIKDTIESTLTGRDLVLEKAVNLIEES